jgi:hypothetical protein
MIHEFQKYTLKSRGPAVGRAEAEPSLTAWARPDPGPSRGPLQAEPKPWLWAEAEPAHHYGQRPPVIILAVVFIIKNTVPFRPSVHGV